jgi:hypothetical protein
MMPEEIAKLRATIKDLESELNAIEAVDPETRRLLEEALDEINAKIHDGDEETAEEEDEELLSDRLLGAAERFETSHPTLFGVIARLADALAQIGI